MNRRMLKISFAKRGATTPGDVLQCPNCRQKFVLMTEYIVHLPRNVTVVGCPCCHKNTVVEYYEAMSMADKPVELPPLPKKKVVKHDD